MQPKVTFGNRSGVNASIRAKIENNVPGVRRGKIIGQRHLWLKNLCLLQECFARALHRLVTATEETAASTSEYADSAVSKAHCGNYRFGITDFHNDAPRLGHARCRWKVIRPRESEVFCTKVSENIFRGTQCRNA